MYRKKNKMNEEIKEQLLAKNEKKIEPQIKEAIIESERKEQTIGSENERNKPGGRKKE